MTFNDPLAFQARSSARSGGALFGGPGDGVIDLRRLWHVVLKRWWVLAGSVALLLVLGVIVTLLSTPVYRASATIQIDREAAQVVDVEGVLPAENLYSAQEFYQTQYGLLKSRSLAERVVTGLGLASDPLYAEENRRTPTGQARPAASPAETAERKRKAIDQFIENLRITAKDYSGNEAGERRELRIVAR